MAISRMRWPQEGPRGRRVLLRARHALVLEVLELLLVVRDLLRHALELARGRGVRLTIDDGRRTRLLFFALRAP